MGRFTRAYGGMPVRFGSNHSTFAFSSGGSRLIRGARRNSPTNVPTTTTKAAWNQRLPRRWGGCSAAAGSFRLPGQGGIIATLTFGSLRERRWSCWAKRGRVLGNCNRDLLTLTSLRWVVKGRAIFRKRRNER